MNGRSEGGREGGREEGTTYRGLCVKSMLKPYVSYRRIYPFFFSPTPGTEILPLPSLPPPLVLVLVLLIIGNIERESPFFIQAFQVFLDPFE